MQAEGDIIQIDRLDCRITHLSWAFEKERAQDILSHWRTCCQRNPSLYDGRVSLAQRVEADLSNHERVLRVDFLKPLFRRLWLGGILAGRIKPSLIVFLRRLCARAMVRFY